MARLCFGRVIQVEASRRERPLDSDRGTLADFTGRTWRLIGAAAALAMASAGPVAAPLLTRSAESPPPMVAVGDLDGHDPRDTHCTDDAMRLDSSELRLPAVEQFGALTLPAGAVVGVIELLFSPQCRTAWAELTPTGTVNRPEYGTVSVELSRPGTATSLRFAPGTLRRVYVGMLLIDHGCVLAHGTITTRSGHTGTATTECHSAP
jgi:hypothetical protein